MKNSIELPLAEPLYSTYHDGIISAVIADNPSLRNWFISNCIVLHCNKKFLTGYTSPEIHVENYYFDNPCAEIKWIPMQFLGGYTNAVIRNLIDLGYYVYYYGVDDYYIEGKSYYKEKHFNHDGAICGYNQFNKTFCIYAYDKNWIYRKFWVSQEFFNEGRKAIIRDGECGGLCAIKSKKDKVDFSLQTAIESIEDYLGPEVEKYYKSGESYVRGIVVHKYISKYIDKLMDGSIPYERMDRRVFRLIWEHKKVMYELITLIEKNINIGDEFSDKYMSLVHEANNIRMMYASHYMKRRDSVLSIIQNKLIMMMDEEYMQLNNLLEKIERFAKNGTLEVPQR